MDSPKAARKNSGKPRLGLISDILMEPLAYALMNGVEKYSLNNWRKGFLMSELHDSTRRHLAKFMEVGNWDTESGVHHLGHAMANIKFMIDCHKNHPNLDDRHFEAGPYLPYNPSIIEEKLENERRSKEQKSLWNRIIGCAARSILRLQR